LSSAKRAHEGKSAARDGSSARPKGITEQEVKEVEELSTPRTPVIYEIVRRLGEEEMQRPIASLWWSGVAAGLSISFSLLTQALLQNALPDAPWRPLVTTFGYSLGFLMCVLSRQQLFTESTITAVLPVAANLSIGNFLRMGRMWAIVLAANLAGTLAAALFCTWTAAVEPRVVQTMLDISRASLDYPWHDMFFRAITAGFLMAAMVWVIPGAEGAQFHLITLITYVIGLGHFTHIIAGSVEAFMLAANGTMGVGTLVFGFIAPTLLGNIIGGTALFALLAYAQVMKEI
jgi:formate-nitrite transporter family protein